jgi:citrate lyase beta subunit
MKTTFTDETLAPVLQSLARANAAHDAQFPGESADRQPVHSVYGGAHLFKTETAATLGLLALDLLRNYAPDSATFAQCVGLTDERLASKVYARTIAKLEREPVEDFRIDFEDGYGNRPDAEEDGHAVSTAQAVARGAGKPKFPPFIGIRIKPFTEALQARSIRTLDLFLTALIGEPCGVPAQFIVTLPKITAPEQVTALVRLFETMEKRHGLAVGSLKLELMIETTQSIFDAAGVVAIPKLVEAAEGRCRGLHFGVYDYTASCNITAEHQTMVHPSCDFARHVMQISAAGRGLMLSDGATNIMPVPRHRGASLTAEQISENRTAVQRAMRLHFDHVQRSLMHAYYQGWDLHPGQLPTRFAAVYAFFLQSFETAAARLRNFVEKAAQATLVGDVFDDAATGQGLLNFFLRGINCGAFTEEEACSAGLTLEELRGRSFLKILNRRRASAGS